MTEPVVEVPTTIDVIAPSNLQEGYQFQVDAGGGKLYTVQVPPGGVTAGDRFAALVVQPVAPAGGGAALGGGAPGAIPRGHWRDQWMDCFNKVNAQCCLACFCPPCAVGQIMTRMNLDWKADSFRGRSKPDGLSTFKITVIITAVYHIIAHVFSIAGLAFLESVAFVLMAVYATYITCKTRRLIRDTYSIPVTMCTNNEEMEDCCCSFWCNCCTACHMARHLVDYDQYSAQCCTDTGLGPEAPPLAELADSANYPPPPPQQQPTTGGASQQQQTNPTPPVQDEFSRENEKTFVVDL